MHLVLTPNRSLSPRGFRMLMAACFLVALLMGLRFMLFSTKAWPVLVFMLLDVLLLFIAFKVNYASAREREELRLDETALEVTQRRRDGRTRQSRFNPHWVRVVLQEINEFENRLQLTASGQSLSIGSFLSPHERIELRDELNRQLARVRRPAATASP